MQDLQLGHIPPPVPRMLAGLIIKGKNCILYTLLALSGLNLFTIPRQLMWNSRMPALEPLNGIINLTFIIYFY